MTRALDPRHGIHDPTRSTPARAPGSIRRTSTIDMPDGLLGDVVLVGRARDLATNAEGEAGVAGEAGFRARVGPLASRKVIELATFPEEPAAASLIGVTASSGFRAELERALPAHREARSLLHLLLDDLPVASLVSGYAIGAGGVRIPLRQRPIAMRPDLCAGWRTGGTMLLELERDGHVPSATGPAAPSLSRPDDPIAWHGVEPLPPHGMRRHRRLDVIPSESLIIDALFRDSHMSADAGETIVHEYSVRARIEPATLEILDVEARAGALPWMECNPAAASARRLVGRGLGDLRPHVRAEFTGPTTCTHLNDTLRSLEDAAALIARLPRRFSARRALETA